MNAPIEIHFQNSSLAKDMVGNYYITPVELNKKVEKESLNLTLVSPKPCEVIFQGNAFVLRVEESVDYEDSFEVKSKERVFVIKEMYDSGIKGMRIATVEIEKDLFI
jgi:hypothetical protein